MWGSVLAFLGKNYKWILIGIKWIPRFYKYFKKKIMSERLGLLTKEQEQFLGSWLDEKIKFNNPILESVDTTVFTYGLRVIDDLLLEKIPENWQSPLEKLIDSLMEGDITAVTTYATQIINGEVDIPVLDEEMERVLIQSIMTTIAALIMKHINK